MNQVPYNDAITMPIAIRWFGAVENEKRSKVAWQARKVAEEHGLLHGAPWWRQPIRTISEKHWLDMTGLSFSIIRPSWPVKMDRMSKFGWNMMKTKLLNSLDEHLSKSPSEKWPPLPSIWQTGTRPAKARWENQPLIPLLTLEERTWMNMRQFFFSLSLCHLQRRARAFFLLREVLVFPIRWDFVEAGHSKATVNIQSLTGDKRSSIACKESNGPSNLLHLTHASHGFSFLEVSSVLRICSPNQWGFNSSWCHRVDTNTKPRPFHTQISRHLIHGSLGGGICETGRDMSRSCHWTEIHYCGASGCTLCLPPLTAGLQQRQGGSRKPHARHEIGIKDLGELLVSKFLRLFPNVGTTIVHQDIKLLPWKLGDQLLANCHECVKIQSDLPLPSVQTAVSVKQAMKAN